MKRGPLIAILTILALGLVIVLWNQSRPGGETIDRGYAAHWQRNFRYRTPGFADPYGGSDLVLSDAGLDTLKGVILSAAPVRSPIRIMWEHLRYWANSRLYPVGIRIEDPNSERWLTYYQRGEYAFLRHNNPLNNAVIAVHMTTRELEDLLVPFVVTGGPFDPGAPAEAEPDSGATGTPNRQ